jgi:glutamate-1-semialdehyde 2,1-aminomutase
MFDQHRYTESNNYFDKVEKIIPLGSQTFSKSITQYPRGISPLFSLKSRGSKMWDIDGNEYVDLVNSLAAVTLGHGHPAVTSAVKKQLRKGVLHSLPGKLEYEVAQLICELIPSSEMVRFAKNGTDATSAAIRLARAYTGRDHIAVCGYHGWQDWYIGTTSRNKGVPEAVSKLSHTFTYNDIDSLRRIFDMTGGQIAAVIIEPMSSEFPKDDFLQQIKLLTAKFDSILIFDEIVTGFRLAEGGGQELFGVIPDLTTLGKGMANGFPLSAIVGRSEIMKEMNSIFFSGTFGGELLSLAAAKAVLKLHQRKLIVPRLISIGNSINEIVTSQIQQYDLSDILTLKGHPSWKIYSWIQDSSIPQATLKTLFLQEMFANGVLTIGSNNVSTAISRKDLTKVSRAFEGALSTLARAINRGSAEGLLKADPLIPLFRVR